MDKRIYKKKCNALFKKAKKLGVMLDFSPEHFNHRRLDCLWYGGKIAEIKTSDRISIVLSICGDVKAVLLDKSGNVIEGVSDTSNCGAFYSVMGSYLQSDYELYRAIENDRLVLENNNWVEYDGYMKNSDNEFCVWTDLGCSGDNVLDGGDILEAINEALDNIETIQEEIQNDINNVEEEN